MNKLTSTLLTIGFLNVYSYINAQTTIDTLTFSNLTETGGKITDQYNNSPAGEGIENVTDGKPATKFLTRNNSFWIIFESNTSAVVNKYALTSANDFANRDPKAWTFYGSNDGMNWKALSIQSNQNFLKRFERKVYLFNNTSPYRFYKLQVTQNHGDANTQLSEFEVWGTNFVPAAPANFTAEYKNSSIELSWYDMATNEDGFLLEKSASGNEFVTIADLPQNTQNYSDGVCASSSYVYRIAARNSSGASQYIYAMATSPVAPELADITNSPGGAFYAQYTESSPANEGYNNLFDNDFTTKYLTTSHNSGWIIFKTPSPTLVTQYAITSANDAPERDPKNWVLECSNDSIKWILADSKQNQLFGGRFTRNLYQFDNDEEYTYYRLSIQNTLSGGMLQIAEIEFFGTGGATITDIPAEPAALKAIAVTDNQIILTWNDLSSNEDGYEIFWSTDASDWDSVTIDKNNTEYHCLQLNELTSYYYKIRAFNSAGKSGFTPVVNAETLSALPPETIQEKWGEHNQLIKRTFYNDHIAVYIDDDMDPSITWYHSMAERVWRYTKATYGDFSDPRLYVIMHQDKYSGGHPATYFDPSHYYLNAIDMGQNGSWDDSTDWNLGILVHETGHIVEGASKHVRESPAFGIWGDSKWMEIYTYDIYLGIGKPDEAQKAADIYNNTYDNFPVAGSQWFKNWFFPIYDKFGETTVLNNYFTLLGEHFPQKNGSYTRAMNWGEFVHFWSAAANFNLKAQATLAFGWPIEWENQFKQAQIDFPLSYHDNTIPEAPLKLVASAVSENKINLYWIDLSKGEHGTRIERSENGIEFTLITNIAAGATTFTDSGLTRKTKYIYRINTSNEHSNSLYSNTVAAVTFDQPLVSPANLLLEASERGIEVCWADLSDNEAGFRIERAEDDGNFKFYDQVLANTNCYVDTNTTSGITYKYRVRAENTQEVSAFTNEAYGTLEFVNANNAVWNNIRICPNPAQSFIVFSNSDIEPVTQEISVFSADGKEVYTLARPSNIEVIHLENFAKGIYFIRLKANSCQKTLKLIVQ
ncbi:MAG: fibronectin type III domain-containing protein [Bacteroidales bacterium]|nr:fibronectin type III domain-containing protein [Bacteroidales bacterium]